MLRIVLADHLQAGLLEEIQAALRPTSTARHHVGQHLQALRILEESGDSLLPSCRDERAGIEAGTGVQNLRDVLVAERIETQHRQTGARGHLGQVASVVRSEPVRLAARQAKTGPSERIDAPPQCIQRRPDVAPPGAHLVETIDEERLATPFGMHVRIESEEVARRFQTRFPPECGRLGGERRALAGAGVPEQHVGRNLAERGERSGTNIPGPLGFSFPDLGTGARNDAAHPSSHH